MIHRIVIGNAVYRQAKGWKGLPKGWTEKSLRKFWKDLTGERKHKVDACIEKMTGDVKNPGGFCAGLADEAARLGIFPKDWREEPRSGSVGCSPCEARRGRQAGRLPEFVVWWDDNLGREGAWGIVEHLPYGNPPTHILASDPNLSDDELRRMALEVYDVSGRLYPEDIRIDRPRSYEEPGPDEDEYYEEGPMPESAPVLGPSSSDWEYWSRYGAPAAEPAPIFEYNVEDLDQLVVTALVDEAVEGGDMYITVDIRPAQQVHEDLTEVENVINAASLITTKGGEYVVEAEGSDVIVTFSADSREVDKLIAAFLEE